MKQELIKNDAMFTIDLLKGHGVPPSSGPAGLMIVIATSLVPVLLAVFSYGLYHNNDVVTKIEEQKVLKIEDKISGLAGALETKKSLERKKVFYNSCLYEVKSSIRKYSQWSPVLSILLEEMPSSVVLTGLEVDHEMVQKSNAGPNEPISPLNTINVNVTKLKIQIRNNGQGDYAKDVKDFRNRLYESPALGSKLEDIIFSREAEQRDGIETISYEIECVFKSES